MEPLGNQLSASQIDTVRQAKEQHGIEFIKPENESNRIILSVGGYEYKFRVATGESVLENISTQKLEDIANRLIFTLNDRGIFQRGGMDKVRDVFDLRYGNPRVILAEYENIKAEPPRSYSGWEVHFEDRIEVARPMGVRVGLVVPKVDITLNILSGDPPTMRLEGRYLTDERDKTSKYPHLNKIEAKQGEPLFKLMKEVIEETGILPVAAHFTSEADFDTFNTLIETFNIYLNNLKLQESEQRVMVMGKTGAEKAAENKETIKTLWRDIFRPKPPPEPPREVEPSPKAKAEEEYSIGDATRGFFEDGGMFGGLAPPDDDT